MGKVDEAIERVCAHFDMQQLAHDIEWIERQIDDAAAREDAPSKFRSGTECFIAASSRPHMLDVPRLMCTESGMMPEQQQRFMAEIPAGALKHGGHIYVSGSATAMAVADDAEARLWQKSGCYLWRNQYASVSSWADNTRPAFDRWMWPYRALCAIRQALDHPQRGVKGCGLGLLRKGVRKFIEASPKDSNGYYELKTAVRLLSTKRGRKLARKAGVNVGALHEKLEAWPKSQQPDIMVTSKAVFENMVVVYQELT